MSGDEEIVVTIEPELDASLDAGTGDGVVKVVDKGNDDPAADLKSQFAKMQGELSTANQRVTAAETDAQRTARLLDEERQRNKALETDLIDTKKSTVEQALESAKADADAAQAEYERAFADGDGPAAARAQRKMSQAEGKIGRLTEAQEDLAATAKAPRKVEQEERHTPASSDPVEQYVKGRSAPTTAWIKAHPEFVTDQRKNMKLTGAHFDAVGEGLTVDTPEYFAHIEKTLGLKKPGNGQQQQRRPSAPTAPGADVGGRDSGGGQQVTLKPHEARAAQDGTLVWNVPDPTGKNRWQVGQPIGLQEMARRKLAMQKEGRYDRSMTES